MLAFGVAVPAQAAGSDASQDRAVAAEKSTRSSGIGAFRTMGDNVHFSHQVRGNINAHGWWKSLSGPARGVKAKVTVWLQVKRGGAWKTIAEDHKNVYQGGGSGKRAAAAHKCTPYVGLLEFRSVIDVDLIGYPDDSHKKITATQKLGCGL
ncbi:hypothetical protein [Streptomyces flavofungini]|uniref:hypothetical protein n=1 Tax=Streptomyces flavofungini TaxID=68200 RepID=UPI0034DF3703